jgi:molecular chaperone GrpE
MKCIGEVFNTDLHEALSKIPSKSKKDKGKIVDVVEKGYFFNDKVLRYAKVIIAE